MLGFVASLRALASLGNLWSQQSAVITAIYAVIAMTSESPSFRQRNLLKKADDAICIYIYIPAPSWPGC